ncbi:Na(+)/H(+) antiporter subunit G [Corynebacterium capitovis DSM 44611]|uniref:monovalent cation/H(+) antiporter subunit G n=1 Tax=Corynebacterium capitovis TaxID=131081 RepID=UPI000361561A|nr:monovalent cation/H(+) antiporter subunit G [Corynebacterium capitovis]WKD58200.1 Na(+)/H(+) antiporter subunit G [Corynebacterium capitovis DSM 44611]
MNIHLLADIISLLLILPGAFMVFSAAVGVVRFPSTMARIHAITKPQTTGLVLLVAGTLIRLVSHPDFGVHQRGDAGILLLLVVFALMTNPVTAQRLSRVARREGLYGGDDAITVNERPAPYYPQRTDPPAWGS